MRARIPTRIPMLAAMVVGLAVATADISVAGANNDSADANRDLAIPKRLGGPKLLFKSGFDGAALSSTFEIYGHGGWQQIAGTDDVTGFAWPPAIGVRSTLRLQMIVGVPVEQSTITDYIENRIETVTGRNGTPTRALYQLIKRRGEGFCCTQDTFMLQPAAEPGDMYVSFWVKLQPDLLEKNANTWKALFEWKTAGDYRVLTQIMTDGGAAYWRTQGDNVANGNLPKETFWRIEDRNVPVPIGEWFKYEVFWHRSDGPEGRVWAAVNGKVIADRHGPLMGVHRKAINRIMLPNLYQGGTTPQYQWVDDLEIWNGFPPLGDNPPYGPH